MLLAIPAARAQVPAEHAVIATALLGSPTTQLLSIDLGTRAVLPLSRFAHGDRPPLALRVDPINRDVLIAVDLGGASRILRLGVRGAAVVRVLADVPGTVTDLAITYPGNLAVSVGGAQGGLVFVPRNGGTPVPSVSVPRIAGTSALSVWRSELWLAESGSASATAQIFRPVVVHREHESRRGTSPCLGAVESRARQPPGPR